MKDYICTFEDNNNNRILGYHPYLKNSNILFKGVGNVLYCEKNIVLENTTLNFNGDHSLIYLNSSRFSYKLDINMYNSNVLHIGKDNYMNDNMSIILSEGKNCFIGDQGAFSKNVIIRNQDPHLIYSCVTMERLNVSKSIYIGDHVWIGQDSRILKGTNIDSGSILGGMSVIAGKHVKSNTTWAGNPAKLIRKEIFWDLTSVHHFTEEKTEDSMYYCKFLQKYKMEGIKDFWVYQYNEEEYVPWQWVEDKLLSSKNVYNKIQFLQELKNKKRKNRFVGKGEVIQ